MESFRTWRAGAIISGAALAVVLVLLTFWGVIPQLLAGSSTAPEPAPTASATPTATPLDPNAVWEATNVKTCTYQGPVDDQGLVAYNVGALKDVSAGNPDYRQWSTGYSTPINATDPLAARTELQAAIWHDPLLGVGWATFFANHKIGTVSLTDSTHNVWLQPFVGNVDVEQINDRAAKFIPLLNVDKEDMTASLAEKSWTQNTAYQELACYVNTLLGKFDPSGGIQSLTSPLTYGVDVGTAATVDGLPEIREVPEEKALPTLVLALTIKGACVPEGQVGANTGDKRPEVLVTPDCTPPTDDCVEPCVPVIDCPPGTVRNVNGFCVTPKSSKPEGYVFPTDKPKAGDDGGTDTAPVVPTSTPTPPAPSPSPTPVRQDDAPTPSNAPTSCPIPPGMTTC